MRILLASPESEVWNSRKHVHMGLGYLAGSLRAHGYECEIWDASVEEDVESFEQKLARDPFDVVCLSAPTPLSRWVASPALELRLSTTRRLSVHSRRRQREGKMSE